MKKIIEVRCLGETDIDVYEDTVKKNAARVEKVLGLDAEYLKMLFKRIVTGASGTTDLGEDAEGNSWVAMSADPNVVFTVNSRVQTAGTWHTLPLGEGVAMMARIMGVSEDSVREDFKDCRSVRFSTDLASYSLTET